MITSTLILSISGLWVLGLILVWLTRRTWRLRRALVKWPVAILAGLLTLVALVAATLPLIGIYRIYQPTAGTAPTVTIATTPERLARGERLAYLCVQCHSSTGDLPLDGADEDITDGALGNLYGANLTPAGEIATWSDGELIRAIREGIHQGGRTLLLMPSDQYRTLSDEDVSALVAYLRSQPTIVRDLPSTQVNGLGAAVIGAGVFPISRQAPVVGEVTAPPNGPNVAYGEYLVTIGGCAACHGAGLRGGTDQFVPLGPNLPALVGTWTTDGFVTMMRTGVNPYGRAIDPDQMPWDLYNRAFTDKELQAVYAYIRTLPVQ
jgi:mono/diheme cytochrome c family protein